MAEDFYDNPEPSEEPTQTESKDTNTALLPKSFFGGEAKAGDTCEIEILKVHEEEVEVACRGLESEEEEDSEEEMPMEGMPAAPPGPPEEDLMA